VRVQLLHAAEAPCPDEQACDHARDVRVLVIDIGTSSVRASVLRDDASVAFEVGEEQLPDFPADGLVEFDALALAECTRALAQHAIAAEEPVDGVGICNQRSSTVVWDRTTGEPVGPALGWQDLRTIGACLQLRAEGVRVAPNQSATKLQWLVEQHDGARSRDLCFGTVDTWIAWKLSGGEVFVTDAGNAGITGLARTGVTSWDPELLATLGAGHVAMPAIVDSAGAMGVASELDGAPPFVAILGDQQASLAGQSCVRVGDAKITFGTGGMLDVNLGNRGPSKEQRAPAGTFPIVAWRSDGVTTWGSEAVMLAAGTNVQWLRDDLGLVASADETHTVASQCADSGGVWFVPAPLGLGTPTWDYGARSGFFGLTRGSGRAEVVRAVLEGIAHRGADLVEAAELDTGVDIEVLRVDGGMSDNPTFVQAVADASQRPVEISPVRDATTRGAGLLALVGLGVFPNVEALGEVWEPRARVEPARALDRDRWREARRRVEHWIPELSGIDF
jgi:glycerol kinase